MKRKFLHEMSHFICGNEDLKGWTQDGGYVASPWDAYYYGGLDKPGKEGGIANDAFGVFSSSVDWLDYY